MRPERDAGAGERCGQSGQFGEKLQHFGAGCSVERIDGPFCGLEAFCPRPVREQDLVPIEEEMDIGDAVLGAFAGHARQVQQMLGGNKHLILGEVEFCQRAVDENPVLRRDDESGLGSCPEQRPRGDADRLQRRACQEFHARKPALADPAQGLKAVIPCPDQIAGAKGFDRDRALGGKDLGPGGEADDDEAFDVREAERADDRDAVRAEEGDCSVLGVQRIIGQVDPAPAEAGDVDRQRVLIGSTNSAVDDLGPGDVIGEAGEIDEELVLVVATEQLVAAGAAIEDVLPGVAVEGVVVGTA
jgi:hypothetical protein